MDLRRLFVVYTTLAVGFTAKELASYRTVNTPQEVKRMEVAPIRRHRAADAGQMTDDHKYYTAQYYNAAPADYPWIELSHKRGAHNRSTLTTVLSSGYRLAQIIETGFTFPYYGHPLSSVVVTTGGFLYMNVKFIHSALAATQYVAPLMANFDFQLSRDSSLYYAKIDEDGVKKFVVQWDNVTLKEHQNDGQFIFQCVIIEDGTIVFSYKKIPLKISSISDKNHPVTVGIADAFYVDVLRGEGITRFIYEYHIVDLTKKFFIVDNTVIVLTPVKNCISAKTCSECDKVSQNSNFTCGWCPKLSRCSDGIDRHRQEWIDSGCDSNATLSCKEIPTTSFSTSPASFLTRPVPSAVATVAAQKGSGNSGLSAGAYVGIALGVVLSLLLIGLGVAWFVYGYTHPNSKSGRWLIEHGRFWKKTPSDKYTVNETTA